MNGDRDYGGLAHAAEERTCARRVAAQVGIAHYLVEDPQIEEAVAANPPDRCYRCKKIEFGHIITAARSGALRRSWRARISTISPIIGRASEPSMSSALLALRGW